MARSLTGAVEVGLSLLLVGLLAGACGTDPRAARPETPVRRVDPPPPVTRTAAPSSPDAWVVRPSGAGPLRISMSLAELRPYLSAPADTAAISGGCGYVSVAVAPDSLVFMVEERRLVRVDVVGGPTATAEGARVGDTEERIRALYPGARTEPHQYVEGHYLIAIPGAPRDTLGRYVFETDGRRVTTYRAGVYPPVEYVEGCS